MKITPIKTYFELSRVVNFLTKIIEDNKLNIDRDFVSLVALNCSGIKNKDLNTYKCRANHYLKDAFKVNELPTTNSIVRVYDDSALGELCTLIDFS